MAFPRHALRPLLMLALLLAAAQPTSAVEQPTAHALGIPACMVVVVQTLQNVDSATAKPGDFFRFQTINSVTAGSKIVIPAKTPGYGVVSVASPAGPHGTPGTLLLDPRFLKLSGGGKLGIVLDHNAIDLQKSGTTGNAPGYLGAIPVPGLGVAIGAFNYFHHGNNTTVAKGAIFAVFPSDDPAVARCQKH